MFISKLENSLLAAQTLIDGILTESRSGRSTDSAALEAALIQLDFSTAHAKLSQATSKHLADHINQSDRISEVIECLLSLRKFDVILFWRADSTIGKMVYSNAAIRKNSPDKIADFVTASKNLSFPFGDGAIGKAWKNKTLKWTEDLTSDTTYCRREIAMRVGIRSGIVIPVSFNNIFLGIIECVSSSELKRNPLFEQSLVALSIDVGQAILEIRSFKSDSAPSFTASDPLLDDSSLLPKDLPTYILPVIGVLFGAAFPLVSLAFRDNPTALFSTICTAPIVLGFAFYLIGLVLRKSRRNLKVLQHAQNLYSQVENTLSELKEAQTIAKIGSWHYNLVNGHQTWSSEHYNIFEIQEPQPKEKLYKLYRERIHPDDLPILDQFVDRAVRLGENFIYNHRVYLDGGTRTKYVRGIGKVTKDKDGNPVSISGTCQDLTDLITLQKQHQFILKSMGIGIWKFDPNNQNLEWDQSMYELYEVNPNDFSGHYEAWENCLSKEAKEDAVKNLTLAISGEKEFNTTFEITTKSGKKKQIGGKGIVIRNTKQEPIVMYGINWDKTNEYIAQQETESMKHLLQNVIDASPSVIFVKDLNGKYLICNDAYAKNIGKTPSELIGKSLHDLFPKATADKMTENDRRIIESQQPSTFEEQFAYSDTLRWNLVSLYPIYDINQSLFGIGGIITDIQDHKDTQDKYNRELEIERSKSMHNAKLALLGEMSAGIAHEINNPLTVIAGNVSLLDKFKNDPDKFASKIDAIKRANARIEKIVKGLKKFSRSSGESEQKFESVHEIIKEVLTLTEAKSKRHSTPIFLSMAQDSQIYCDGIEIEQVLVNLVNNGIDAVKNSSDKWIKINVFEENGTVVMQVLDSGKGLPPEIETKLFQPFFTTKPVGEGTGLGLSIAKGILDNHKAHISINRSFPNTCFEIRFPKTLEKARAA